MHPIWLAITFMMLLQSALVNKQQNCLSYDPAVVALTGTVKKVTFPGPPNYESVTRGDRPESTWVLYLNHPACVMKNDLNDNEGQVLTMQLVFSDPNLVARYKPLLGKQVTVEGTLFHSQTGHHHTKVLITVKHIRRGA